MTAPPPKPAYWELEYYSEVMVMIKKYSPLWMRMKYNGVEVMNKIILWRPLKELEYHDSMIWSMIFMYSPVWVRMEYYNVKVMDKRQEIVWGSRDIKQVMQYPFKITQVLEEGKLVGHVVPQGWW